MKLLGWADVLKDSWCVIGLSVTPFDVAVFHRLPIITGKEWYLSVQILRETTPKCTF